MHKYKVYLIVNRRKLYICYLNKLIFYKCNIFNVQEIQTIENSKIQTIRVEQIVCSTYYR